MSRPTHPQQLMHVVGVLGMRNWDSIPPVSSCLRKDSPAWGTKQRERSISFDAVKSTVVEVAANDILKFQQAEIMMNLWLSLLLPQLELICPHKHYYGRLKIQLVKQSCGWKKVLRPAELSLCLCHAHNFRNKLFILFLSLCTN